MGSPKDSFQLQGYRLYVCHPPPPSKYSWVACSDGVVPPGAIAVGTDKDHSRLYIGRGVHRHHHGADLIPGKIRPNHGGLYIGWDGREHMKREYEALVCNDFAWKHSQNGSVPPQALSAGHTSDGETLYIGRAFHDGTLTPGKIHPSYHCLFLPYNYHEVSKTEYETLILL